jgi:hypothetical protein
MNARLSNANLIAIQFKDIRVDKKGSLTIPSFDGRGNSTFKGDGEPISITIGGIQGQAGLEDYFVRDEETQEVQQRSQIVFIPDTPTADDITLVSGKRLLNRPGEKTEIDIEIQGQKATAKMQYAFETTIPRVEELLREFFDSTVKESEDIKAYREFEILTFIAENFKEENSTYIASRKVNYKNPPEYAGTFIVAPPYKQLGKEYFDASNKLIRGIPLGGPRVAKVNYTDDDVTRTLYVRAERTVDEHKDPIIQYSLVEQMEVSEETQIKSEEETHVTDSLTNARLKINGKLQKFRAKDVNQYLVFATQWDENTVKIYRVKLTKNAHKKIILTQSNKF